MAGGFLRLLPCQKYPFAKTNLAPHGKTLLVIKENIVDN